jgi:hypothetical protein
MADYNEETLSQLLRRLPTPPQAWVTAAQEIPLARRGLDEIVGRAEADLAFRAALIADLESALEAEGYEHDEALVEALRNRFSTT